MSEKLTILQKKQNSIERLNKQLHKKNESLLNEINEIERKLLKSDIRIIESDISSNQREIERILKRDREKTLKKAQTEHPFDYIPSSFQKQKSYVVKLLSEEGNKVSDKIAEAYLIHLYEKVKKYTKGNELIHTLSFDGKELNGTVSGNGGRFNVSTIFAGGYNIQRLHYRTIVQRY